MTLLEIYAVGVPILALVLMAAFGMTLSRRDVAAYKNFATHDVGASAPAGPAPEKNSATVSSFTAAQTSFIQAAREAARQSAAAIPQGAGLTEMPVAARLARPRQNSDAYAADIERAAFATGKERSASPARAKPSEARPSLTEPHERALAALDGPVTMHRRGPVEPMAEGLQLQPASASLLKSGVIDGMAYSLYADGAIETAMPDGIMRFESIADLRRHLEQAT